MDKPRFIAWFVEPLEKLYEMKAGFPILLISFPILERYLREVSGCAEKNLSDSFHYCFIERFQEIESVDQSRQFWKVYRHGLVHQLTFSLQLFKGEKIPPACITFDQDEAIQVLDEGELSINPIAFSKKIITEIIRNFEKMEGMHSPNHPTPFVFTQQNIENITGTASDERWKKY